MSNCDYDNLIENPRIARRHRPSDKLMGSCEQFTRYDAFAYEFAREMDARYRAMREGNEAAHDLVGAGYEAAVEGSHCPEGTSNMRDFLAEWRDAIIKDYIDESALGADLPSWDDLREEWYDERLEREM